jgi:hypothetical protein
MTNLRQAATLALEALEQLDGIDTETECVTIDVGEVITALRTALEQSEQKQKPMHPEFRKMWEDYFDKCFRTQPEQVVDCPRCGHVCSQRPWQGLTDEDVNKESAMIASKMKLAFHAGMYVAQKILQERNT